ncbi:c6 finger domain-containing protein [Stemphylium lycopersici]|nr:c6 finger domain-containing protein [Stemphylium lycopersici]
MGFDDAWKAMDGFGQEAGKRIGGAAAETVGHLDAFGQEAGKHIGGAACETAKHLDAFGQEAGKNVGSALEESWKSMDAFGQEAGKQIAAAVEHTKDWIEEHPGETSGIVACVLAAPAGAAIAGGVLHMVGFTATGVAAGSAAAAAQSGIGSVTAGSPFALLQSAGAGGAAATLIKGLAAGTATAAAIGATALGLIKAIQNGKKEVTVDHVHYVIHQGEEVDDSAQDGEKKDTRAGAAEERSHHFVHMAEAVAGPTPPTLKLSSPDAAPVDVKPVKKTASATPSASKKSAKASDTTGVTKRKQSKSRNGCITCKAKRLKCDEKKPTCDQCAKRAVTCGGYKKDFKWRPFEEPNAPGKPAKSRKGQLLNHDANHSLTIIDSGPQIPAFTPPHYQNHASLHDRQHSFSSTHHNGYYPPPQPSYPSMHGQHIQTCFSQSSFAVAENIFAASASSALMITPQSISPVDSYAPGSLESNSTFGDESTGTRQSRTTADSSVSSGQSPRLVDLLMPGTDLSVPPEEYSSFLTQHEAFYQPTGLTPPAQMDDDDIEELVRGVNDHPGAWIMRLPSPTPSSSSGSSPDSPEFQIPAQIQLSFTSAESLTRRYDRDTCGVLSVKDGPTENPWRTLVWPLTRDCPALYHAIASMTSFHQSKDMPTLRIQGIDHMRSAVHALAAGLQNMRVDAAISTTLVLAFAESWDQHISTGINHIKGAKILINQALIQHRLTPMKGEEWTRLKFLCNTWIYMDVLARLTSTDDDETNDVDTVQESIYATGETDTSLDPLMGCAHTLFPIIGRVANLVRKVRRSNGNGPTIISQAVQLKSQLEEWTPPSFIEDPEDETTSPHDTIKTAVAYQYATLLYLHQAVPEVPSQSPSALAKKVLCDLATVDPRSRSIIVHIYPLMAAGCEATDYEEREWVKERWGLMSSRMKLGIIERCLEVTKEVWNRRDARAAERMTTQMESRSFSGDTSMKREFSDCPDDFDFEDDFGFREAPCWERTPGSTGSMDPEVTVKGRLHWLGVMKDWNWEILLG